MELSCKFLTLFLAFFKICYGTSPQLVVSNSGPCTLGASVTFNATLLHYGGRASALSWEFRDAGGVRATREGVCCSLSLSLAYRASAYHEGHHDLWVTVYKETLFFRETLVSSVTRFLLNRELLGRLSVFRPEGGAPVDQVAVGEPVSMALELDDPGGFLSDAQVEYAWSVDWDRHRTEGNTLVHNFTDPGPRVVKGIATALFPDNTFRFGFFEKTVLAKVPVNSINVSGNPFLYHGDTLNLNVTCKGTPPFVYCYEILRGNASNFTCGHVATFTTCRMEIVKYFQVDGTYRVAIFLSNNVRDVTRVIEVVVYSVSVHPTLSIVVVPVVCGLLTLSIVALGVSRFLHQRRQMAVEVAHFDFQDESDFAATYGEQTFFESLFSCRRGGGAEEDPLVD